MVNRNRNCIDANNFHNIDVKLNNLDMSNLLTPHAAIVEH